MQLRFPENTMPATQTQSDPAATRPWIDEADIGSGEKTPGQIDTDTLIRQIPPLPAAPPQANPPPAPPEGKAGSAGT
jgi:hypothetical protein